VNGAHVSAIFDGRSRQTSCRSSADVFLAKSSWRTVRRRIAPWWQSNPPSKSSSRPTKSPPFVLEQRTWLLHWSLFVFWNDSSKGLEYVGELFKTERYLQAITTKAPHLLRYLTSALLLSKRRVVKSASGSQHEVRRLMKNLVRIMQHCDYTDPIVEFVDCLCVSARPSSPQIFFSATRPPCSWGRPGFLSLIIVSGSSQD